MKIDVISLHTRFLFIYIFVAVNDIILIPIGGLWVKNVLLIINLFFYFRLNNKDLHYLYIFWTCILFFLSFLIALIGGNNTGNALNDNLSLLITLVLPLLVIVWINNDKEKMKRLSFLFLYAILFATVHKILFSLYSANYINSNILFFLFKDIQGRGLVGEIYALNTGNQLLVLLSILLAFKLFIVGHHRFSMIIFILFGIVNTLLSASRFFTPITLLSLGVAIYFQVKGKYFIKSLFIVALILFSYNISSDLFAVRNNIDIVDADLYRYKQNTFLFDSFLTAPFFGNGPGFSIDDLDAVTPWLFENQFLAMFSKYGLIGSLIFFGLLSLQFKLTNFPLSRRYYFVFLSLIFLSSVFNPYIFGTYAACAFSIILILSHYYGSSWNMELISGFPH